jgi:predicted esterase
MDLLDRESAEVPYENIIIGGLSQGCAMALICLLSMTFPVGGFVGMSGWMPFRHDIEDLTSTDDGGSEEDDVFGSGDDDSGDDDSVTSKGKDGQRDARDPMAEVLEYVTEMLSIEGPATYSRADSAISTPVFLGHGEADEKIRPSLGEEACRTMKAIGFDVTWKIYEGQGHWYRVPEEIDDIVEFIRTAVRWNLERGQ